MKAASKTSPFENPQHTAKGILARFAQVAILFVLQAVILFPAAGRLDWSWAWVFLGIYVASITINGIFLIRTSPETIAERGQARMTKQWDRIVGGLWSLMQFLLIPLVAGLDVRFGWSQNFSTVWHVVGAVAFALGLSLFGWALIANTFFSTVVRIQSDRGQAVCKDGPYRFVRHPGYTGAIIQSVGVALLLGSWWALIPAVAAVALMIARTSLEDRTLQTELPGYEDYLKGVHFRLVPGIW
ncbi:MAG TPA: isoprenylcysteine carboxylmethyltransferase family protein [Anaerolineales bacterium]|jgi:protein-S-isoprenylcysteine O-methyltransferase Ste14|nr:isoprenylcysteine carboxylmethyltransferase family protein [Anaerolineales bacterium]